MTFRDFMERALYEPDEGYYSRSRTAWSGVPDYVTAPQVDAAFGVAVARLAQECDAALGRPDRFDLVDFGGGDGALLADVCAALQRNAPDLYARLDAHSIERGHVARHQQRERLGVHAERVRWLSDADELAAASVRGLMLSNELLDAFAVHRVAWRDGALREVYVDVADGVLVERQDSPSTEELAGYLDANEIELAEGQAADICLAVGPWIQMVSRALIEGFVLTVDYGAETSSLYGPERMHGSLVCQYRYRPNTEPLERVGRQDITAHVDFGNLRRRGAAVGLEAIGDASLAVFLVGFGAAEGLSFERAEQPPDADKVRRSLGLRHLLFTEIGDAHRAMLQCKSVDPIPFGLDRLG
jgi:SAM-dependent MidA family methyltransferase